MEELKAGSGGNSALLITAKRDVVLRLVAKRVH